jgi:hypothetical protein
MVEESALAIFDKLKRLPLGMKESFAKAFAKGAESLLAQQESMLASREAFHRRCRSLLLKRHLYNSEEASDEP